LLYEWSKNFSKRKENSSLPSLGCFWLNREEKIREWSLNDIIEEFLAKWRIKIREWSLNNIIEESYQIEDNWCW
jgi:hypothetical protein